MVIPSQQQSQGAQLKIDSELTTEMPDRIRKFRRQRGMSMREVADLVGTSQQQIDRLEKGKRRLTIDWLIKLCGALNYELVDLMPEINTPQDNFRTTRSKVIGRVVESGLVEWMKDVETYPVEFGKVCGHDESQIFGLVVCEAACAKYGMGTELIFAQIDASFKNGQMRIRKGRTVMVEDGSGVVSISKWPLEEGETLKAVLVRANMTVS